MIIELYEGYKWQTTTLLCDRFCNLFHFWTKYYVMSEALNKQSHFEIGFTLITC